MKEVIGPVRKYMYVVGGLNCDEAVCYLIDKMFKRFSP